MFDISNFVRPVLRSLLAVGSGALVAPWLALAILMAAIRLALDARLAYVAGRAVGADSARCPRGHESNLHGIFECRCGALFAGWAFGRCPVCAESCGYVGCEHCGLAVRNPVVQILLSRTNRT